MITQPVVPRVPLALQASAGVVVDPVTGTVTINPSALAPAQQVALLTALLAALPTAPPAGGGPYLDNGILTVA